MPKSSRPSSVRVIADRTPGPHRTDSDQALWWWPVLGPCSAAVAFHLSRSAAIAETTWPAEALARAVGLGTKCSKLWYSLDRLAYFGVAEFVGTDTLTIRLFLPRLSSHHMAYLPEFMVELYRHEMDGVQS
jgi:hypothetical protein